MEMPHAHQWTSIQRWLVIAGSILALVGAGIGVYAYERYHRGPSESVFYGTWEDPFVDSNDPAYCEFRKDHTFVSWVVYRGEKLGLAEGTWYAGGPNLYLRYPADYLGPDDLRRPTVCHIVSISPDDIAVRLFRDNGPYHFRRAHLDAPKDI